jgi:hypothetical protein
MERFAKDKHSSLLRIFVNRGRKKFYKIGTGEQNNEKKCPLDVGFEAELVGRYRRTGELEMTGARSR